MQTVLRFGNFKYVCINGGIRITEFASEEEETVVIPESIDGRPVIEIGVGAFYFTPITEVFLPDCLERIEEPWTLGAMNFHMSEKNPHFFSDGFALYRLHDGEQELVVSFAGDEREEYEPAADTTIIGENSISGNNNLRRVVLPETVHTIGETAFEDCGYLTDVVLNEGLLEIGADAFSRCIRLTRLHLPASLERIGERALSDTFGWSESYQGLESITVEPGNEHFTADETGLFEIAPDGRRSLIKYLGQGEEYRIPGDVSRILPGAFRRAKLRRVIIPGSVESIGKDAFRECRHLSEIVLEATKARVYIPLRPQYRKDEVTALICRKADGNGLLLDRAGYDRIFATWLDPDDKCGMACFRLLDPVLPDKETERMYREYIEGNFEAILKDIAKHQDMNTLKALAELDFLTGEHFEQAIDLFATAGQAGMTAFLLSLNNNVMFEFEL